MVWPKVISAFMTVCALEHIYFAGKKSAKSVSDAMNIFVNTITSVSLFTSTKLTSHVCCHLFNNTKEGFTEAVAVRY